MQIQSKSIRGILALALLAGSLTACGTSHITGMTREGQPEGELRWPEIRKGGWMQEGTFPNIASLRDVNVGMTKDQLYQSLGRPHFNEGTIAVREWNYIFNFRTGGPKGEYVTCQYKVLFDKDYAAQSFHWREPKCAQYLEEAVPAPPAAVAAAPMPPRRVINLSADALFRFDGGSPQDVLDRGRREVEALAPSIIDGNARVQVIGYTDRLGGDAYNQRLSGDRANTVRQILIERGVNPDSISAEGRGESSPTTSCGTMARADLISCLQPDRRVELIVEGISATP